MTEQEKRENVIEALEMSYTYSNVDDGNTLVPQPLVLDIIALLKAQEPVEPTRKPEIFDSLYFCGKCSAKVGFQIRKDDSWRFKFKFCPNCGQAVKWE